MKRNCWIALGLLPLLFMGSVAWGQDATRSMLIRWKEPRNAVEALVTYYKLYRTPQGGPEEAIELGPGITGDGGSLEAIVGFLSERSYRISLAAVGPGGESPRSNEVTLPPVPGAPRELRIEITVDLDTGAVRLTPPAP